MEVPGYGHICNYFRSKLKFDIEIYTLYISTRFYIALQIIHGATLKNSRISLPVTYQYFINFCKI